MDDLLIFTKTKGNEVAHVIFVPAETMCENCGCRLTGDNAMETDDEVLVCEECFKACSE